MLGVQKQEESDIVDQTVRKILKVENTSALELTNPRTLELKNRRRWNTKSRKKLSI